MKTRLSAVLGPDETLKFYLQCVDATKSKCLDLVKKHGMSFYWAIAEESAVGHSLWADRAVLVQSSGGLGERLWSISKQIQELGYDGFIFMGADCPHFDCEQISLAASYINSAETRVALGPCFDGGYYFLASNHFFDKDFWVNVRYSCEHTFLDVLNNCHQSQAATRVFKKDFDIDTFEEYQKFMEMKKT